MTRLPMRKGRTQMYYMKQCAKVLEQIKMTRPDQPQVFLRLKAKAKKYLELAKSFETQK